MKKRSVKKILWMLAAALGITGLSVCARTANTQAIDAAHNSRNSVSWEGVYAGTIPAADGPGINVRMTLKTDETYEVRYEYIDKAEDFTETGTFTWDENGGVIKLDSKVLPPYYRVGENMVIQLDMEGNPITGDLAARYALRKTP